MSEPRQPSADDPAAMFSRLSRENDAEESAGGDDGDAQVSQSGSSFSDVSTANGGADAVPDTPDGVPEDNIGDAERGDYRRRGQDAEVDRQNNSVSNSGSDVSPDPER